MGAYESKAKFNKDRIAQLGKQIAELKAKDSSCSAWILHTQEALHVKEAEIQDLNDSVVVCVKKAVMRRFMYGTIKEDSTRRVVAHWEAYLALKGNSILDEDTPSEEEDKEEAAENVEL